MGRRRAEKQKEDIGKRRVGRKMTLKEGKEEWGTGQGERDREYWGEREG